MRGARLGEALFGAFLLPFTTGWETQSMPAAALAAMAFVIVTVAHRSHWQSAAAPTGAARSDV